MIEHKMLDLFGGNMAAYGHDEGRAVKQPVTSRLIQRHLEGTEGIGIYPMWQNLDNEQWWVKWGCCDIDTGDWSEAYELAIALQAMGFTPFIERSRSKGWHIWVFSDGPVPARNMRRALKVAYAAINLPAKEANPKQEDLRHGQLGNYVRLPFKGSMATAIDRQVIMADWGPDNDGHPVSVWSWFTEFEPCFRTSPDHIAHWASKWHEPEKKQLQLGPQVSVEKLKQMFETMDPKLFKFVAEGPPNGGDRSAGLSALAWKLKHAGYTPTEAYDIVKQADLRWGKYWERGEAGQHWLLDLVERTM